MHCSFNCAPIKASSGEILCLCYPQKAQRNLTVLWISKYLQWSPVITPVIYCEFTVICTVHKPFVSMRTDTKSPESWRICIKKKSTCTSTLYTTEQLKIRNKVETAIISWENDRVINWPKLLFMGSLKGDTKIGKIWDTILNKLFLN